MTKEPAIRVMLLVPLVALMNLLAQTVTSPARSAQDPQRTSAKAAIAMLI